MIDLKAHLSALCQAHGPSGHEGGIREVIHLAWDGLVDEQVVDSLGSLIATRYGSAPEPRRRILITTHMDEIGLIVTKLDGTFLRVDRIGGTDTRVLLGQPVSVHGRETLAGVVASRPPHVLPPEQRERYPSLNELVIDTGLSERKLAQLVRVGDVITFDQPLVTLENDRVAGKALDNRASVAALTLCLQELQTREHTWDVVAAATVQEEVTLGGGQTVAWRVQPDLAVVIDVTFAVGNGVSEADGGFKLGGGPTLGIGPNVHPRLFEMLSETAKSLEIPAHVEPIPRDSGTEAWTVQVSRDGVPTGLIGIPIRNMHTPVEVAALRDIERAGRLLAEFIARLDETTLTGLALD